VRPEDDVEGECVPLEVGAEELLSLGEEDTVRVPLKESPPLAVEHALGEPELDMRAERDTQPEDDIDFVCSPLAVGVGEPVRHSEGVCDRVPLGVKLPLDVEHRLSKGEEVIEDERELHADTDASDENVALTVGVTEPVPIDEAEAVKVALGERLPLTVTQVLGKGEVETEDESELRAETDAACVNVALTVGDAVPDPNDEAEAVKVALGV
jgi:hypothetical protein